MLSLCITFQGDRFKKPKLLQHFDEQDQDHQHSNHLQTFQVHDEWDSWPQGPLLQLLTHPSFPARVPHMPVGACVT